MSRIIINNNSSASTETALKMVQSVIDGGRVSGDGYCYVTVFGRQAGSEKTVYARKNKKSDSFRIEDVKNG